MSTSLPPFLTHPPLPEVSSPGLRGQLAALWPRLIFWKTWVVSKLPQLSGLLAMFGLGLIIISWYQLSQLLAGAAQNVADAVTPLPLVSSVPATDSAQVAIATSPAELKVHITGAIRKPGVYQLPSGSVVHDLVTKAGGLSSSVWQDYLDQYINLAEPLTDHQKIWIPTLDQQAILLPETAISLSEPTESGVTAGESTTDSTGLISVNTATVSQLDSLAGIGQKRAEDIVAHRPYTSLDELVTQAGVPASILAKIKPQLSL